MDGTRTPGEMPGLPLLRTTPMTLEELRHDSFHMDEVELKAFGRQHRVNPESVEYLEARAEWKRRQQRKKETKIAPPADRPTSKDFAEMAAAAGTELALGTLQRLARYSVSGAITNRSGNGLNAVHKFYLHNVP